MHPGRASAAACMASPRSVTTRTPSSNDSAPAATSAVYSPTLWPAHEVGSIPRRSTASRMSSPVVNVASWALRVSISSSGPASSRSRSRSRPAAADASATNSHEG